MTSPPFVPGIDLARHLFDQEVRPLLSVRFPFLRYSAGLLGSGSEVLGFDTPRSRDHHWGPRLMLFLTPADLRKHGPRLNLTLSEELSLSIDGYPTNFAPSTVDTSLMLTPVQHGPVNHRVELWTVSTYLSTYLGIANPSMLSTTDWLTIPQQKLRTVRSGAVFHDDLQELLPLQRTLHWYPDSLWRALLAAQWRRIDQEEPFPGRCAEVGDELGSRLVTARLVRDIMRLCFLMEQEYTPYTKWFGTAFSRLNCGPILNPLLTACLTADSWDQREEALIVVYRTIASMQNTLALTDPLPTEPSYFFTRPFRVLHSGQFADALSAHLESDLLHLVASIGAVDQWVDSTDILSNTARTTRTSTMYHTNNC
jgi:hypothetical protein